MTPDELTALRLKLKANGYDPIPACGKKVFLPEWPTKTNVSDAEIASWAEDHPDWQNTGIITQAMPACDLDIRDPEAVRECVSAVQDWYDGRGHIMPRTGEAPKLDFGRFKQRMRARSRRGARYGAEFLYGLGAAET